MDRKQHGTDAENRALLWLEEQGLRLIQRNAQCRLGEIDLIMQDQSTLVFIEVRQRQSQAYGGAALSVNWRKQQKLALTARYLLARHPHWSDYPCRFDVVAFEGNSSPIWYKDAFRP